MRQNVRRFLLSLAAVGLVLLMAVSPLWPLLQRTVQPWLVPLVRWSTQLATQVRDIWQFKGVREENEALRHQVAELSARQAATEALRQENEALRQLVALPTPAAYSALAAEVVSQQSDETGTTYLINRGSRDGLRVGLAVVAGVPATDGQASGVVLVGTLVDVGERVARFTLLTSSASRVLAQLARSPAVQSLAVGEYNLAVRLQFLQPSELVAVGDTVVTSNLNANVPPGLLMGTVTTVERTEGELFQSAVVTPPVPLEQFRFLYVLKPHEPS